MRSSNILEFTVSQFSQNIKRLVEDNFGYVKINGEISGLKKASSGHWYFALKDDTALINAICFKNIAQLITFDVSDGLEVSVFGKVTTYEGRSNYQIIVEKITISGIGALLEAINKRKQKLLEEGLFDAVHKKPLPFFPKKIAVITSKTGAVIQDIINRISARCPTDILLYPSLMQGNQAAIEIIAGIKFLNKLPIAKRPQLIIIARGGGSFEDLLPFNDEDLVRAVFNSELPIISAIGHETDTSLIDLVSDLRAPTPTAAAEIATPILADLVQKIDYLGQRISDLISKNFDKKTYDLKNLKKYLIDPKIIIRSSHDRLSNTLSRLDFISKNFYNHYTQKLALLTINSDLLNHKINLYQQKFSYLGKNLKSRIIQLIEKLENNLNNTAKLLISCNHTQILKRGFALIKDRDQHLITKIADIQNKKMITIEMYDGAFEAVVFDQNRQTVKANPAKKPRKIDDQDDDLLF
jgi:exodeoxyribonuclease VII large subunit